MIGCAVFGYPFSFTGQDWRELPAMMTSFLLRWTEKKVLVQYVAVKQPKEKENNTGANLLMATAKMKK